MLLGYVPHGNVLVVAVRVDRENEGRKVGWKSGLNAPHQGAFLLELE